MAEWDDGLFAAGLGDPETASLVGWPARVVRMVEVEGALAQALADVGRLPRTEASAVAEACDPERLDLADLAERAASAATPIIPLVAMLAEGSDEVVAAALHLGATSQDIIDTATALQVRDALDRLEDLALRAGDACATLAARHASTVMAGRTLGQQAVPITFGLKAARWLGALDRAVERVREARPRVLTVQLGGAAGTLAVYGTDARAVIEALASRLGLSVPDLAWHAERDRTTDLASVLDALTATVGTIGTDLVLLAQTEIGEIAERPTGPPTSSAMPHKHNPVHATAARAAARLADGEIGVLRAAAGQHELERAAGAWQAEWVALPSALVRTGGALRRLGDALVGLDVDASRMRRNLATGLGLTASESLATALIAHLGRRGSARLVEELARRSVEAGIPLADTARADERVRSLLGEEELGTALDVDRSVRGVPQLVDRALATHARVRAESDHR